MQHYITTEISATASGFLNSMDGLQSSSSSRWKQWRRSYKSCLSKKIVLLLTWQAFFSLSSGILVTIDTNIYVTIPSLVAALFAPLLGWLADVKFGRYEMIMFSSLSSVIASMVFFLALFAAGTLLKALTSVTITILCFCTMCFTVAWFLF